MAENKDQVIKELNRKIKSLEGEKQEYREMVSPARKIAENCNKLVRAMIISLESERLVLNAQLYSCESRLRSLGAVEYNDDDS